jgi:putative ABC transport system permease protein
MAGMSGVLDDIRYGWRGLRRAAGLSAAAVLTLALGIGVTAALASAVYAGAWRPLPYPHANRLVALTGVRGKSDDWGVAPADVSRWRERTHTLGSIAVYSFDQVTLSDPGPARQEWVLLATPALFATLGEGPVLGRGFLPHDMRPGAPPVAMIGAKFWSSAFDASPDVVGKTVTLDGHRAAIVGVLPPGFGALNGGGVEVVEPLRLTEAEAQDQKARMYSAVALVKPGIELRAAQADLSAAANKDFGVHLTPLQEKLTGNLGDLPWMLIAAGVFILLLACANVAGLLVARGVARQRETAVRMALGAGRGRVVRQVLTEGMILGLAGGALGGWLAWALLGSLRWLHPPSWIRTAHAGAGMIAAASAAAALAGGVLASVAPAWRSSRRDLSESLNAGGAVAAGGSGKLRGRLVAAELAMALVLAASAGVLIRTVAWLTSQPLGFDVSHVFTTGFGVPFDARAPMSSGQTFYQRMLQRVRALPGVRAAALTNMLPFEGYMMLRVALPHARAASAHCSIVTPGYFSTLAIPLLRGRGFGPTDRSGAPGVAVVNQVMAEKLWPGRNALGQQFTTKAKFAPGPWTVVGVAGNTHDVSYRRAAQPEMYFPLAQVPYPGLQLVVLATGDPAAMLRPVQAAASVDRNIPLVDPMPLSAIMADSITQQRFLMKLLAIAAGLGLLLAMVGVYGAVGTWVAERTREVGVRMALGADRGAVLGLVLGCAARWAATGAVIGAGGAYFATRALRAYLFGVKPGDPATLALGAALLFAVALAAAWLPARRAAAIDPAVALRRE